MADVLQSELDFFRAHLAEWLSQHEGKFALIKGTDVSFFEDDEKAYEAGLKKWGEVPMLIKRVEARADEEGSLALICGLIHVAD